MTKLSIYKKTGPELYGKENRRIIPQADAEIKILKIFKSKIIDKNITPCILELVYDHTCSKVESATPSNKVCDEILTDSSHPDIHSSVMGFMCKYKDLVKNGLAHNKFSFLVMERCDTLLDDYLKKSVSTPVSIAVFKSIIFQIIYTIYAINKIFPGFRHYDLHTDNVMLKFDSGYKFKATNPKFLVFHVDDEEYCVPYFGIIPKIIDFGFSILPEKGVVSNITADNDMMFKRVDNDLLFLYHHIYLAILQENVDTAGKIEKILTALEPNRTFANFYAEHIRKIAKSIPTYEQMVKNRIFHEYKKYRVPQSQIYAEYRRV
jgi:serine/threonine protein kinase